MQHHMKAAIGCTTFRRRAAAVAVASTLAAMGSAQAFEIDTGNPDIALRWDNTVRYNLGARVQDQNSQILGNPNFDDGDRNFGNGSIVTNRVDALSEFDFVWKRKLGFRVSGAGWWDSAYNSLDNTNTATANTLVNGLPVAGVLSPYTKRYAKGASGEWLDAFGFANFDIVDIPFNVKAGQHTVFWGDSLLLGGAIHGVSYSQNSIDVWKGFATPGSEAKELFRPRGGLTLQAQPSKELSVAGQWFYNWQAIRVPESGSYLTVNDGLQFGGDSTLFSPNPYAALVPGAPAYLRLWNENTTPASRYSSSLGDWGVSARWSPQWLDGTLGFYYRNTTDIAPQVVATLGAVTGVPAATCTAIGGTVVPGACVVNKNATTPDDLTQTGQARNLQPGLRRRHPHCRRHAVEGFRRRLGRCRVVLSRKHAAQQRPGDRASGAAGGDHSRCHRDDGSSVPRHAGRARQYDARRRQRDQHLPQDRAVRHGDGAGRTDVDAVAQGDPERSGVPRPRQLHRDRQGEQELLRACTELHADLVSGPPGRRHAGADQLERRPVRQRGRALRWQ